MATAEVGTASDGDCQPAPFGNLLSSFDACGNRAPQAQRANQCGEIAEAAQQLLLLRRSGFYRCCAQSDMRHIEIKLIIDPGNIDSSGLSAKRDTADRDRVVRQSQVA